MSEFTAVAHRYLDAWNETDPAKRRGLVEEVFAADATYTDSARSPGTTGSTGSSPGRSSSSRACGSGWAARSTAITTSRGSLGTSAPRARRNRSRSGST